MSSSPPAPGTKPVPAPAPAPGKKATPPGTPAGPPGPSIPSAPKPVAFDPRNALRVRGAESEKKYQEAYDASEYNVFVPILADALQYQGFNAYIFREEFQKNGLTLRQLLVCLTALAISGNNPARLTDAAKVTNAGIARRAYDVIRTLGITGRKSKDNAVLTLSRVGIAYIAIYWCLRRWLISQSKLLEQFPGTVPLEFQDPNMGAIAVVMGHEAQYRQYETAFSDAVASTRTKAQKKNTTDWLLVATNGLSLDQTSRMLIRHIITDNRIYRPDEMGWMLDAYTSAEITGDLVDIPPLQTKRVVAVKPAAAEEKEEEA